MTKITFKTPDVDGDTVHKAYQIWGKKKTSGKFILVKLSAGWMTPQLKIQITPLHWGFEFCYSKYTLGLKLGPIAMLIYFGPAALEIDRKFSIK